MGEIMMRIIPLCALAVLFMMSAAKAKDDLVTLDDTDGSTATALKETAVTGNTKVTGKEVKPILGEEDKEKAAPTAQPTMPPTLPPPPPAGESYFRMATFGKDDSTCSEKATDVFAQGTFDGKPTAGHEYCFPKAVHTYESTEAAEGANETGKIWLAMLVKCDDYCIHHSAETLEATKGTDEDRPMAGPCMITLHQKADCKDKDWAQGRLSGVIMNAGCQPDVDPVSTNITHRALRCHNCCSSVGMTAIPGLVMFVAIIMGLRSQQ